MVPLLPLPRSDMEVAMKKSFSARKFSAKKFRQLQIALGCFVRRYEDDTELHARVAAQEAYDVLRTAPHMTVEECSQNARDLMDSGRGIMAEAWMIAEAVLQGRGHNLRYYKLGLLDQAERQHRKENPHYWDDNNWPTWRYRSARDFDMARITIRTRPPCQESDL